MYMNKELLREAINNNIIVFDTESYSPAFTPALLNHIDSVMRSMFGQTVGYIHTPNNRSTVLVKRLAEDSNIHLLEYYNPTAAQEWYEDLGGTIPHYNIDTNTYKRNNIIIAIGSNYPKSNRVNRSDSKPIFIGVF